jgi:hypothetical protein
MRRTIGFRGALVKRSILAAVIVIGVTLGHSAAADEQCLTTDELHHVARMGAVMGFGGGLRRCGNCLGARNRAIVDEYEATGMLVEFRRAEAALQANQSKFEYTDGLVRDAARKYANDVSADCKACEATALFVEKLTSAGERTKVYGEVEGKVTKLSSYKACP